MYGYLFPPPQEDPEALKEAKEMLRETSNLLAKALDYKYEFRKKSTKLEHLYQQEMEAVYKVWRYLENCGDV